VSTTPPTASREVTLKVSARLFGALHALVSLTCAVVLAVGLSHLAHRQVTSGIWLVLAALITRSLASLGMGQWHDHASAVIRHYWRTLLPQRLTRPRSERERSRADLALAIDQAADAPFLIHLQTSALLSLAGLLILFWAGGWLAFTITVALLLLAVPLYQRAGRRSEAVATEYLDRRSLLEQRQLELLYHTTELRALGAVDYGANEIAAISDSEHVIAIRAIRVTLGSSLVTEFLSGVSIGLVAMVVGFALLGGRITLAHALIAVLITSEVFVSVRRFGVEFHRREDAERARDVLTHTTTTMAPMGATTDVLVATDVQPEFNDVALTFVLHAGERLVITGPSGSGKTTLLHTLLSWRVPRRGDVARTGAGTGHVSVESSLLSGTLRDNVTLGINIDESDVASCLSSLGLTGPRFRDLDTTLLVDGGGISSGERVRLVLARCLLARPALLVLDDIAGVLDEEARILVRSALGRFPHMAIVEATVDTPLLTNVSHRIELAT
jgi:ABC-type transport system involved in cytochrome bd biosynthesis fused ATPase/permease subunit